MNFYDKLNDMIRCFKDTDDYKKFIELKVKIKEDKDSYEKLKEFKEKQTAQQVSYMEKGKVDENSQKELENLYSIIVKNDDIRSLLEQEMKLNIMLADVQKALGEAVKELVDFKCILNLRKMKN